MRGGQGTGSFGGGGIVPAIDFSEAALSEELIRCRELIMAMERENAALRDDAERYRFIRGFDAWGIFDHKRKQELDAAIDASRKEMQARATETNVERRGGCTLTDCRDALDE